MKTMVEICRKIWVESVDKIDLDNLGCHWTSDDTVWAGMTSFGLSGKNLDHLPCFRIYAFVEEKDINIEATKVSNEFHPEEKEIVLNQNVEVIIDEILDEDWNQVVGKCTGNSGTRMDEWAKRY